MLTQGECSGRRASNKDGEPFGALGWERGCGNSVLKAEGQESASSITKLYV
jgi:hypothetical protein